MEKYTLLPDQLLYEGTCTPDNFFAPASAAEAHILAVHEADYWYRLQNGLLTPAQIRRTGFPWSASLVQREVVITEGTRQCAEFALAHGIAMNIAGGTHHAFADRGEGFCLLNDIAVAACWLLSENKAHRPLIVDLDVHQGNGTASLFTHNPAVFTFSAHGANNYPLHKEKSDLDLPLPDGTNDESYLSQLSRILPQLIEHHQPDFVFYLSGVDVLATDKLGKLALTREGCKTRDRMVLQICKSHKLPVVVSMGGGYSARIADIVEAHANTFRLAQELFF